jgi:hypothetical protein
LPNDSPPLYRNIIESEEFLRERDSLGIEPHLMDEALEGLTWVIARSPEWGKRIGNTPVHTAPFEIPEDNIQGVVYYTFNEQEVILQDIRISK